VLRSQVITSLRWAAIGKALSQLITWVITILVVRILNPADYGLMALATLVVSFLAIINELGIGAALVQRKELDDTLIRRAMGLIFLINIGMFLALYALAPLVATFFEESRLTAVIQVAGLEFVLMAFAVVPQSLLQRNLDFKNKSIVEFISNALASVSTLTMALSGFGVWALVAGNLLGVLVRAVGFNLVVGRFILPSFSFRGVGSIVTFGGYVTGSRLLWYFYSQADVLILGKIWSKELVGVYSVAMHLGSLPMQKISGILNQVALPAFSRLQEDFDRAFSHYLMAAHALAFLVFPVMWGISSVSAELIELLLGGKWAAAAMPMQIISLAIPLRMLSNINAPAAEGMGYPSFSLYSVIVGSAVMPLAFWYGSRWGVNGVAMAWVIAYPLVFGINMLLFLRVLRARLLPYIAAIIRPATAGAVMYAAVHGCRLLLGDALPLPVRLLSMILTGVVVYGVVIHAIDRRGFREVWGLLRGG
jgi:O-antigen/teichoic acid export membrane protein